MAALLDIDDQARARRAIAKVQRELPVLTAFMRGITKEPNAEVRLSGTMSCTDGTLTYVRVPIELGDEIPHEDCASRDKDGVLKCPSCRGDEDIFATLIHEAAHNVFGSFAELNEGDFRFTVDQSAEFSTEKQRERVQRAIDAMPKGSTFRQLGGAVSPHMPQLVNSIEDARVNRMMRAARPGTKKVFSAQVNHRLREGINFGDGRGAVKFDKLPPDAAAMIWLLMKAQHVDIPEGAFDPALTATLEGDDAIQKVIQRVDDLKSHRATYALSFAALRALRDLGFLLDPEDQEPEEPDEPQEPDEGEGEPEPSDGQPEEGESDESDDDESQEGDPCDNGDEGEDGPEGQESGEGGGSDESDDTEGEESEGQGSDEGLDEDPKPGNKPDTSDDSDEAEESGTGDGSGNGSGGKPDNSSDNDDAEANSEPEAGDDDGEDGSGDEDESSDGQGDGDGDPSDEEGDDAESGEAGDDDGAAHEERTDNGDRGQDGKRIDDPEPVSPEALERAINKLFGHDTDDEGQPADVVDGEGNTTENGDDPFGSEGDLIDLMIKQGNYFSELTYNLEGLTVIRPGENHDFWRYCDRNLPKMLPLPPGLLTSEANKLRHVFAANQKRGEERNLRRGRHVVTKSLASKVAGGSDRMFGKFNVPNKRDYFVVIALDISGSTGETLDQGGNRVIDMVKLAAFAQAEMLHRVGVDFAVYAHSGNQEVWMAEIKGPKDPWATPQKEALARLGPMLANYDGHALEFLRKLTEKSTATDKLIMYYTDGEMPAANGPEEREILIREVEILRKQGVNLVGVGVETSSPTKYGLETVRLDKIEDVSKVVKELERKLR